jgi:inward rectifier potassium channel
MNKTKSQFKSPIIRSRTVRVANVEPEQRRARLVPRGDGLEIVSLGQKRQWLDDLYARLLGVSWKQLMFVIVFLYMNINLLFAACYLFLTDGIENARHGSFLDAFFFSVQTMATIGYGKMSPIGVAANALVTLEALLGFGYFAVVTGLLFSKFSRPTARVLFSEKAVICPYDGVPTLMLRLANERTNRIVNASVQLVLVRKETNAEGIVMRRFHDLAIVRSQVPLMQVTWTVMHLIDETSPLFGATQDILRDNETEIIVSLTGLDETMSQTIHARYSYISDEIACNYTFEDVLRRTEDGRLEIHYHLFHNIVPLTAP